MRTRPSRSTRATGLACVVGLRRRRAVTARRSTTSQPTVGGRRLDRHHLHGRLRRTLVDRRDRQTARVFLRGQDGTQRAGTTTTRSGCRSPVPRTRVADVQNRVVLYDGRRPTRQPWTGGATCPGADRRALDLRRGARPRTGPTCCPRRRPVATPIRLDLDRGPAIVLHLRHRRLGAGRDGRATRARVFDCEIPSGACEKTSADMSTGPRRPDVHRHRHVTPTPADPEARTASTRWPRREASGGQGLQDLTAASARKTGTPAPAKSRTDGEVLVGRPRRRRSPRRPPPARWRRSRRAIATATPTADTCSDGSVDRGAGVGAAVEVAHAGALGGAGCGPGPTGPASRSWRPRVVGCSGMRVRVGLARSRRVVLGLRRLAAA